ncbi:MAG: DUF4332 domain-containing protein [Verrucomicrobiota bacterium]
MPPLTDIPGIDDPIAELLAAVDITSRDALAKENVGGLYARLYQANEDKNLVEDLPPIDDIQSWIDEAARTTDPDSPAPAAKLAPPPEPAEPDEPPLPEPPAESPKEPQPIPAADDKNRAAPESVGRATLLVGLDNDAWMEAYEHAGEAAILEPAPAGGGGSLPESSPRRKRFDKPERPVNPLAFQGSSSGSPKPGAPIRKKDNPEADGNLGGHQSSLKSKSRLPTETSARIAASTEDLPKRARRGLLVTNPFSTTLGFIIAIATRLLVITMLIGTPIVLIYFNQYMLYFAAVPALLVLFALLYVAFSSKVFCRVCGSNVLIPQKSHKHEKSHQLFGFGYIGSMSLHGLLFGWFRCPQCGSAMRIRK